MSKFYYCNFCEELIAEDDLKRMWDSDGHGIIEKDVCPNCGYDELEEAETCRICGKPIKPFEAYCEDCKEKVYKVWDDAICEMMGLTPVGVDYAETKQRFIEFLDDTGVL